MLPAKILLLGKRLIERGAWYFAPFSFLYAWVVFCRNKCYDWHFFSITRVDCTVVSIGNIVAGGTGKTPFALHLAKAFSHRKVAILSRGYGEMPDEPRLLARRLPGVSIYVGKNRAALAKKIAAHFDLLILDDGFQHRKLARDFDLVLGETKGRFLPWGFLRDSPKRVPFADEVFLAGQDFELVVSRILDLKEQEIPSIRGWKVAIFCGIAHPLNFKKIVEKLGAEVVFETFFADHEVPDLSRLPKGIPLICTEKDFVKVGNSELPICFLEMEIKVSSQQKWEKLIEKIDQKIDNRYHL